MVLFTLLIGLGRGGAAGTLRGFHVTGNPLFWRPNIGGFLAAAILNFLRDVKGEDVDNSVAEFNGEWFRLFLCE